VSEIERLSAEAAHARRAADYISDAYARAALGVFADELERKAAEMLTYSERAADMTVNRCLRRSSETSGASFGYGQECSDRVWPGCGSTSGELPK